MKAVVGAWAHVLDLSSGLLGAAAFAMLHESQAALVSVGCACRGC